MKRTLLTVSMLLLMIPALISQSADPVYIIIAWNDLGMHCSNKDFSSLAVLPPYNNVKAQVIKRGDADNLPEVIATGFKVTYEIPGNTYSVGKTNFWTYVKALFGVDLQPNIGLKGAGLTGNMDSKGDFYMVEGIPITPFTDADLVNEDPYQLGLIKLLDSNNKMLASTQPVIPVSNEISCVGNGCHSGEASILNHHPKEQGFDPTKKPILCATCHASNALGMAGKPGINSLSQQIHDKHEEETSDCYKCHPGQMTRCFRDTMFSKGLTCQTCHGSLSNIAKSIENGRRPWLDEPKCGDTKCHGATYAEETGKLFRESRGHGGLFCSACHGSPHALVPTVNNRDNAQNVALQGYRGVLSKCIVCHGVMPKNPGPHNIKPSQVEVISANVPSKGTELNQNYPNPVKNTTLIPFKIKTSGYVKLEIYNSRGEKVMSIVNQNLLPGEYKVPLDVSLLTSGVYTYRLITRDNNLSKKLVVTK